jgi:hypothetical protein
MAVSGDAAMPHPTPVAAISQRRRTPAGCKRSPGRVAVRCTTLGAALWLASACASASPPWLCSLSDEATRLICVVDQDAMSELSAPPVGVSAAAITAAAALARPAVVPVATANNRLAQPTPPSAATAPAPDTTRLVNGTSFPLDPARVYTVDLWAPATEREWVEQLAHATICYRSPGCQVIVTGMDDHVSAAMPLRSAAAIARLTRPGS